MLLFLANIKTETLKHTYYGSSRRKRKTKGITIDFR
jgi:hypothetical protein